MTATTEQSGGLGDTDSSDCFECSKGNLKIFKFVNRVIVKKIDWPVVGTAKFQEALFVTFFVNGCKVSD